MDFFDCIFCRLIRTKDNTAWIFYNRQQNFPSNSEKGPGMIFKGNPKNYLTEIQLPFKG